MEAITTPQSHKSEPSHLIKSASRLAQMANADIGSENENQIPHFSVEFAPSPSPPKRRTPSSTPSKLSIRPRNCIPLHELLLLSPPVRKSKTRLSDRLEMADDGVEPRRRCKSRGSSNGVPSPRNLRRSRRRIEHEERECVQVDEVVKPRKRRQSGKSRKEKNTSIPSAPASNENVGEESALDCLGQMIWELVMWRDTAKSSLWFGFGCLCFLSSCFTKGLNIRENVPMTREVKLTEEDVLRVIRVVLPALNLAICKTRKLFSGEPSTTLKVAIFFLFGGEYGHFLTLWRLCTLAFVALVILRHYRQHVGPKLDNKEEVQLERQAAAGKQEQEEAEQALAVAKGNHVENQIKE
ncbi:hypothetical protein Cgig2_008544 [Carnegiea gigantea]|uniref:Reticulon domain-containing protein n=1 Tax=Carnegiea gigantea TaxID=171969 RepID=A0A9Q1JXD5_9CARY|nr:hypothetical protein Cgig2_008544 [Carnegiea gigantea]